MNMRLAPPLVLAFVIGALALSAAGATSRPLVELYTSEGCDSCPPADRWLAANFPPLPADAQPVALAFHVDYWDRLGWADRFATPAYTERQYDGMRANRATFVYTPQVMVQGHDFGGWREADATRIVAGARARPRASLSMDVVAGGSTIAVNVDAQLADAAAGDDARLFVAYTDSGLHSDVKAGENRGRRLAHDHVVRTLKRAPAPAAAGRLHGQFEFTKPAESGTAPVLVAFVQRTSNGDVLQSLPLSLDACLGR
ncbi:MAG: DUF1223 domain-containing protein [Betaproteobacteria bacterium]